MIVALVLGATIQARADGGAGGASGGGVPGGAGGSGFTGNPGSDGSGHIQDGGGGGGGAAGGGNGGNGGNAKLCNGGAAGSGGTALNRDGQAGGDGACGGAGGGGGGGGYNGNGAGAATISNNSSLIGGNGGQGGSARSDFLGGDGGGGGGGSGGYGAVVTGSGASANTSSITGGNGGSGGAPGNVGGVGVAGNGGDGGVGVQFTATGATFTNSGTVTGGDGGAAGAANGGTAGNPGAGGAGIVGADLTIVNSGAIKGGLSGDGVTRANAITFTGGTNVLELQAGFSIIGNVVAFSTADTLRLGGSSNASFDVSQIGTQYLGFGIFQKTGASTWTLTGANAAALAWGIDAGTLMVNGTMANSTMTVNSGGTLAGIGTVGNVTVTNGGTFAPGSGAPGSMMTVAGNLAFQSGSLYLVEVYPATASTANVVGTATLTGGSVETAFAPGSYMVRSYDILHAASGLIGTFSDVSGNVPAGFSESLSYTATDVFLNLTATLGLGAGLNENQQNVATALNNFFNSGGALPPNFVNAFGLTGGNLGTALTLLSGEAATGNQQSAFQLMSQFLGIMLDPFVDGRGGTAGFGGPAFAFAPEREELPEDVALAYAKLMKAPVYKAPETFEQRWTAWGGAFGGYNRTSGDPAVVGSHDLNARAVGGAAGLEYHVTRDTVVGFGFAGGHTSWDLAQDLGGGKSDAFMAGVYGATRSGPAYVAASVGFANHWMSTDRFAPFADHLTASFDAQSIGGRVEGGYRFATPVGGITPYAAVQAQIFHTPTYSETDVTAGGFGLTYDARTASDTRSELGARFDRVALVNPSAVLTLRGRLAWAHDWVTDPSLVALFQELPGASFIVNGALPAKDSALASAGAELRLASGVTLLAKFDGEFAGRRTPMPAPVPCV